MHNNTVSQPHSLDGQLRLRLLSLKNPYPQHMETFLEHVATGAANMDLPIDKKLDVIQENYCHF